MKDFKKLYFAIIIILLLSLSSCSKTETHYLPYETAKNINSILVLPFEICSENGESFFYCPVRRVISGYVEPSARETLDKLLKKILSNYSSYYNFVFLSQNEFENIISQILEETKNPAEIVKKLCKKTNTQVVLYGRIYRFIERKGSSFSIVEPASVAFALVLYDGETGKILWMEEFDETQKPLSENVLNIKLYGRLKWLSAEELAERGLIKIFKTFPVK
uniref:Lipoprotein n=1 Tax=Thermodesulfobacterium geofontis TaxID=1295609 RepID=A0A7V5XG89_9BACT